MHKGEKEAASVVVADYDRCILTSSLSSSAASDPAMCALRILSFLPMSLATTSLIRRDMSVVRKAALERLVGEVIGV